MGGNYRQQMGPLYHTTRIQDTIQQNSSFIICSDQNESVLLPVSQRRDRKPSQQMGSGKGNTESGNSWLLFPDLPSSKKEWKVTFDHRPFFIEPIHKETVFQNGNGQVGKTSDKTQRLGCLHRLNGCIPTCSDTSSIPEVSSFRSRRSGLSLHGLIGMSLSPLIFSKLMDVIAAFLGQRAISVFPYLDDWLIKNLIRNRLITQTRFCIQTIQSRFSAKSQEIGSLSFSEIHLYRHGISDATKFSQGSNGSCTEPNYDNQAVFKHVSARTFLSLLGKLSAAADFILLGRLHLRPLQMCLLSVWKPHILPLNHPITINGMIRSHLQWWINPNRFETGTSIHPPDPKFFLYADASYFGWGAHLEPTTLSFHGRWTEDQSQLHINMLEMMAIRLALKQAITFIHHSCIMISTDNTTVVSYINKQGGTHSPNLCVEVWKILNWCLEQDIVIRVPHIPGRFNILADCLSRLDKPIKTEWALDQTVANSVFQMLNFPNVDLFATRFNHKLPLYVSPVQDYKALAIDAQSMDWNHLHAYALPPFILIPAVLEKIRQHQYRIVLIALFWPQQQWFSELLLLLVSAPIRLPLIPKLLTQSKGRFVHQNLPLLDLHAWELSNNQSEIKNFCKTLQILSLDQEEHLHKKSTMQNGPSSLIGVIQKRLI